MRETMVNVILGDECSNYYQTNHVEVGELNGGRIC